MNRLLVLIVISILLSSCGQVNIPVAPSTTPSLTFTPPPSAIATQTSLPIATATPTLSPDPNTYEFDDNVTQADRDLIIEGVRLTRYFLKNSFGSDLSEGVDIKVVNNEVNDTSLESSGGGFISPYGPGVKLANINPNEKIYIKLNTGHIFWRECRSQQFEFRCLVGVAHELTHFWQLQHGCLFHETDDQLIGFLIQGMAQYVGLKVGGQPDDSESFSDAYAFSFWPAMQFNQNDWFNVTDVNVVAVKHLVDQSDTMAFTNFCDAVGNGVKPQHAFQSAFGTSIQDFRKNFMDAVLGQTKTCTMVTCGSGSAVIGQFKLQDFIDSKIITPNLVARFVDDKGAPVVISNLLLARQGQNMPDDNRQPDNIPGVLSVNLFPGSYGFYFCEPGYPGTENTGACHAYETGWFNVTDNQATNLTIQLPPYIEESNISASNLVVKFLDENGNPVPNLRLQICSYDSPIKVCSPDDIPNNKVTDENGIFQDVLRSGKYLIRFNWPGVGYAREWTHALEIDNINISPGNTTAISYQFPTPDLLVKLTDAVGALVPNHFLYLCRVDKELGSCENLSGSPSPIAQGSYTNGQGIFKAFVTPGLYYILTDRFPTFVTLPSDYKISNINVTSETETTTIEYQLK